MTKLEISRNKKLFRNIDKLNFDVGYGFDL